MNEVPNDAETNNPVTVYTLQDPYEAELIQIMLRDHEIDCELDGIHQAGFTGALNIGVIVRENDSDTAKSLIEEHFLHRDRTDEENQANEETEEDS